MKKVKILACYPKSQQIGSINKNEMAIKNSLFKLERLRLSLAFILLLCLVWNVQAQDTPSFPAPFGKTTKAKKSKISSKKWTPSIEENIEAGEVSLRVLREEEGVAHIQYDYLKTTRPTPYNVAHNYYIKTLADGALLVDVDAFMDPMDLYVAETIKWTYEGNAVRLPNNMKSNTIMDVHGNYTLTIPGVDSFNKVYEIQLNDFLVDGIEDKTMNGTVYKSYKLSFAYVNNVIFNGSVQSTKKHQVTGYFIPSLGFVQSERTGTNDMIGTKINYQAKTTIAQAKQ